MDDSKIRSFLAVELPLGLRDELVKVHSDLKETDFKLNLVPKDNIHITIAFLGNVSKKTLVELFLKLNERLSSFEKFTIKVSGLGFFGKRSSPRALWAGIENQDELKELYNLVTDEVAQMGIELEKRDFKPHVTIARIKHAKGSRKFNEIIEEYEGKSFGDAPISKLLVMKSVLSSSGSVYSIENEVLFKAT